MDPADPRTLHAALSAHGVKMIHHKEQLGMATQRIQELRGRQAEIQENISTQLQQLAEKMNRLIPHPI